jgi:hypothetical protein
MSMHFHFVFSFRERGQVIEAEVLDEVANWRLPVGVGNLVARDMAIIDRLRASAGDVVRPLGAEVLIEPVQLHLNRHTLVLMQ